jgi:hypothetical protein
MSLKARKKMSDPISNNISDKPESTSLLSRAWLYMLLLACSLAIFLLGANYYKLFPTNGSWVYAGSLAVFFLIVAIVFRSSTKLTKYWSVFYAFFVASAVNLVSDLFAGYNSQFVQLFGTWTGTNQGFALAKLYDALLVVIPILALTLISGEDLGMGPGNWHPGADELFDIFPDLLWDRVRNLQARFGNRLGSCFFAQQQYS